MAPSPVPVESFGGLSLLDDPGTVGWNAAIDLLNVDFDRNGQVRSRDGYAKFTSVVGTNRYDSLGLLYDSVAGTRELVVGAGNRLESISTAGAVTHSDATPTTSPHFFARYGSPSANHVYIANGLDTVKRYDGTSFTTPGYTGTTPNGLFLATTPWDNRLVNAGIKTGAATKNVLPRLLFSDAGTPTTFNNSLDLHPGDGEQFQAMTPWRESLFVFKETKFFVFSGTSTDGSGNPIFGYRTIIGTGAACSAVASAPQGLYFLNRRGIWLTTGGAPSLVSGALDPIFRGNPSAFFASAALNQAQISKCAMAWNDNRLYVAYPSGGATVNDRLLVFTPSSGIWTLWNIPAAAMIPFRVSNTEDLLFAYASGTNDLGQHSSASSTDAGTAIVSRYRSGFSDLGKPDHLRKIVRQWHLVGLGTVNFGVAADDATAIPSSAGGASTSISLTASRPNYRKSQRGRNFSWQVDVTSGAWRLDSVVAEVS